MHEDVVTSPERNIEWVEEGANECKKNFSCNTEDHERVIKSLIDQRKFASFAEQGIQELADNHSVEIRRLTILNCLSGVANWLVGYRADLEYIAWCPGEQTTVDRLAVILYTLKCRHSKILCCMHIIDPVEQG